MKLRKGESYSALSFSRKDFQNVHLQSLPAGSSPLVSTSKMAPDPLLSFLYNVPTADVSEGVQRDSSTELSLEDEAPNETVSERYNRFHSQFTCCGHFFIFVAVSLIN